MKKSLFLIALLLLLSSTGFPQDKGGMSFLRIGVGGRATGLGEAYTSLAEGPDAAFWNPAGLFSPSSYGITASHTEWFQDITLDFVALKWNYGSYALGLSVYTSNISGIEHRTKATPEPEGEVSAHDMAIGFSAAKRINEKIAVGATVKYLHQKIYIESSAGFGIDLGMQYQTSLPGLTMAAAVRNIGKMNALKNVETDLPLLVRVGGHYTPEILTREKYSAAIAADYEYSTTGSDHLYLGTEIKLGTNFFLRGGYQTGYETRNLTGGFGINYSRFTIDYGYTPFTEDIGTSHRFSAGFSW